MTGEHKVSNKMLKRENDEVVGWDEAMDLKSNEDSIKGENDN